MGANRGTEGRERLRARAEARTAEPLPAAQPTAVLLHELQVHQVELEAQNEELRRVLHELDETRNRYVDLYDFAPVGYLTVGDDGLVSEANLTSASLMGTERERLFGCRFAGFVVPEDQDRWQRLRERVRRLGKSEECELKLRRGDGRVFLGRVDCNRISIADVGAGLHLVLTDVSERERAEEELRRSRLESLSLLAGGIAHDFNNLLTVLFGHVEAARSAVPSGHAAEEELTIALSALSKARGLTRQLLVFSSGGAPSRQVLSVSALLSDAVALSLGGSPIKVTVEVSPDVPLIQADSGQMNQLLSNLLLNARQAMPDGGEVSIVGTRRTLRGGEVSDLLAGDYAEISVRDTGHGIAQENLPHIFDPFFTTKKMGSGLGLATSYTIARRHGGDLWVRSAAGRGTTFAMLLPAAPKGQTLPLVRSTVPAPFALRVLLMDDDPMLRELGLRQLRALGCKADTATRGEDALALFRKARAGAAPYDVVILDLTIIGGMGGAKTIEGLREIDPGVCAVACSGYSENGVMADPKKFGFQAALAKPYVKSELAAMLESVTGTPAVPNTVEAHWGDGHSLH